MHCLHSFGERLEHGRPATPAQLVSKPNESTNPMSRDHGGTFTTHVNAIYHDPEKGGPK
jgi:hypothetical protein